MIQQDTLFDLAPFTVTPETHGSLPEAFYLVGSTAILRTGAWRETLALALIRANDWKPDIGDKCTIEPVDCPRDELLKSRYTIIVPPAHIDIPERAKALPQFTLSLTRKASVPKRTFVQTWEEDI